MFISSSGEVPSLLMSPVEVFHFDKWGTAKRTWQYQLCSSTSSLFPTRYNFLWDKAVSNQSKISYPYIEKNFKVCHIVDSVSFLYVSSLRILLLTKHVKAVQFLLTFRQFYFHHSYPNLSLFPHFLHLKLGLKLSMTSNKGLTALIYTFIFSWISSHHLLVSVLPQRYVGLEKFTVSIFFSLYESLL